MPTKRTTVHPAASDRDRAAGLLARSVPPHLAAHALLHGIAFAMLCLWTRTSPGALRRQFGIGAECRFDLA